MHGGKNYFFAQNPITFGLVIGFFFLLKDSNLCRFKKKYQQQFEQILVIIFRIHQKQ
jgi:hypothetical protein